MPTLNFDELARKVITDIGFDNSEKGFDGNSCGVLVAIAKQSGDIAMGVNVAMESKNRGVSETEVDEIGAGDQGMMFGYACNETETLMPMPIYLAHKLARRLSEVRKNETSLAAPGRKNPGDDRIQLRQAEARRYGVDQHPTRP